ncbi:MAG: hypothetical protein NVSMB3_08890 [Acidobacteriaceae bacterium]
MAQGVDSSKTPGRPSHEAIEQNSETTDHGMTDQEKMDKIGMESAKRAGNRLKSDEDTTPGNTTFTK